MKKTLHIKFFFIFLLGIFVGITFFSNLKAQSLDSTSSYSNSSSHLRIASNINEESLHVRVFPANKNMKYLKIFDIIGNEVASIDLAGKTTNMTFSLNVSTLENGIYLCNLYSDKGIIETKKLYWSK